jgi:hypothetical protein
LLSLFLISFAAASGLEASVVEKSPVVIAGANEPAVYEFTINNFNSDNMYEIFSLEGLSFSPKGFFELKSGKNEIEIGAYPNSDVLRNKRGLNTFSYKIRGQNMDTFVGYIQMRIVSLDEVISVMPGNVIPRDEMLKVSIRNTQKISLENVSIEMDSSLYSASVTGSFAPYEEKQFEVALSKEKMTHLVAGPYIVDSNLKYGLAKAKTESVLNYLEKEGTSVEKKTSGLIIRKYSIKKTNEGNVHLDAKIEMRKNIISRLFASFSVEASSVQRGAIFANYVWEKDLGPGESFEVVARTNYTLPFILVALIIVAGILVKAADRTNLVLKKRVSFVKTKGGEFALKITLSARARRDASNIKIVDYIPHLAKLYEGFGRKPDEINEKERKLAWHIDRLNAGEERVFSYIIYSQLKVVGRFELPIAHANFESKGQREVVQSNRAYFVSELMSKDED